MCVCIYVSDRICKNVHSSHVHPVFQLWRLINVFGLVYWCKAFRKCKTTIPLSFLKVSNLYMILCGFQGSLNGKNQMCELYTFSQIRTLKYDAHLCMCAHISTNIHTCVHKHMHMHTHYCTWTHMHTHILTLTHTDTHVYTHAYTHKGVSKGVSVVSGNWSDFFNLKILVQKLEVNKIIVC